MGEVEHECCSYLELLDAKHVWGGGGQHVLPNPGLLVNVHRADRVAGEELIVDPPCLLGQLGEQGVRLGPGAPSSLLPCAEPLAHPAEPPEP